MGISTKTHKILWGSSGSRCAFPDCKIELFENEYFTDNPSIIGEEAHIVGKEEKGPRGLSPLSSEDRDKADNLILLCRNHHKIIDDDPIKYTVEYLKELKKNHLEWVRNSLSINIEDQESELRYASIIDKWIELVDLDNWKNFTFGIYHSGQPKMSKAYFDNLNSLNTYLLTRNWPSKYPVINDGFNNFRSVLNDFLRVFKFYTEDIGPKEDLVLITEKIYNRLKEWNREKREKLESQYNFHVELIIILIFELTKATNYLIRTIQNNFIRNFRDNEGLVLIDKSNILKREYQLVEYELSNEKSAKYLGIEALIAELNSREEYLNLGLDQQYRSPYIGIL